MGKLVHTVRAHATSTDRPPQRSKESAPKASASRMTSGSRKVCAPDDALEHEADTMANAVVGASAAPPCRGALGASARQAAVKFPTHATVSLGGKGKPLPEDARSYFEPRFGCDFSHVRVHDGPDAARAAGKIGARAFTVGNQIAIGTGAHSASTQEGRLLLAHELSHIVQVQNRPALKGVLFRKPSVELQRVEAEIESIKEQLSLPMHPFRAPLQQRLAQLEARRRELLSGAAPARPGLDKPGPAQVTQPDTISPFWSPWVGPVLGRPGQSTPPATGATPKPMATGWRGAQKALAATMVGLRDAAEVPDVQGSSASPRAAASAPAPSQTPMPAPEPAPRTVSTQSAAHAPMAARSPAVRAAPSVAAAARPVAPVPPAWAGPGATHLHGDIWEVRIPSLGRTPIGPHDQMQSYLRSFNRSRLPGVEAMESAHIVGGEHMKDLGWEMRYEKAPAIGVSKSLHDKWTREISNLQSQQGPMGGRATATVGRPAVGPDDVIALHHEVYRGVPELQSMSRRIIHEEAGRIMGQRYGMPKPASAMDAHKSGMPKAEPAIDAHQGGIPKAEPGIDAHKGGMPKTESAMPPRQSAMPKATSAIDAHQGGMPKAASPMDAHQGGMPAPETPMPAPVPPVVTAPKTGFWGRRWQAAKTGISSGIKGAFTAANLASAAPELILGIADRVAARDAIRNIQRKFLKEGFAKGFAAGVAGWSEEEVASNLKNLVTEFRVRGMHDPAGFLSQSQIYKLATDSENYAVEIGYQFIMSKSADWRRRLLEYGTRMLEKNDYFFRGDPEVFRFTNEYLDKLAWALRHASHPIVEGAIKED
ncbi:MAG: DUF4157 domain-containing protein [Pseudomonadota bacterium]|nr:DUF4157 domain-containing protein [Pseudomonadota bacterium]